MHVSDRKTARDDAPPPAGDGRDRVALGPEIEALLEATGSVPVAVRLVTALPSRVLARASFRIELADGRVLKGRRFDEPAHAERFERLARRLGLPGLPRVVARRGGATLEEWVPGEALDRLPLTPALLRASGELLGRLHARPVPPDEVVGTPDAGVRRVVLDAQLGELVSLGLLAAALGRRLGRLAGAAAPTSASAGFVHWDFCPENLVQGPDGEPVAVDNTTLGVDLHDFDLARTWYRWPMTDGEWAAFAEGYHAHRGLGPFGVHFFFWATAALADAALFRHRAGTPGVEIPLGRLRALAGRAGSRSRPPAAG